MANSNNATAGSEMITTLNIIIQVNSACVCVCVCIYTHTQILKTQTKFPNIKKLMINNKSVYTHNDH